MSILSFSALGVISFKFIQARQTVWRRQRTFWQAEPGHCVHDGIVPDSVKGLHRFGCLLEELWHGVAELLPANGCHLLLDDLLLWLLFLGRIAQTLHHDLHILQRAAAWLFPFAAAAWLLFTLDRAAAWLFLKLDHHAWLFLKLDHAVLPFSLLTMQCFRVLLLPK